MQSTRCHRALVLFLCLGASLADRAAAQDPTMRQLLERLDAQDREIAALKQAGASAPTPSATGFRLSYDNGYRLSSEGTDAPFELRINGRMQFRYAGFDPDQNSATAPRNDFEIERGRLEFRGTWLDPDTHFYINLDADTDDNHQVIFHDFWVNHDIGKDFSVYVGKAFFPGSRDWLSGSTTTHLIDRSMATSFFRPDRTLGVWVIGKVFDQLNYRLMIGNGLSTTDDAPGAIDDRFAYAGSFWWDPLASYGKGYADLEQHEDLALRIGATLSYTELEDGQLTTNGEERDLRQSNGRRFTDDGVDSLRFMMGALDAALKFEGLAINAEAFFRSIDELTPAIGTPPRRSQYDWGGYCDAGFMIIPKTLEPVVRISTVQGSLQDSWEYAGGCNYYVDGTHTNKLSLDVSKLDGSPVSNSGPNYRVGDDGWLFRLQWQIAF